MGTLLQNRRTERKGRKLLLVWLKIASFSAISLLYLLGISIIPTNHLAFSLSFWQQFLVHSPCRVSKKLAKPFLGTANDLGNIINGPVWFLSIEDNLYMENRFVKAYWEIDGLKFCITEFWNLVWRAGKKWNQWHPIFPMDWTVAGCNLPNQGVSVNFQTYWMINKEAVNCITWNSQKKKNEIEYREASFCNITKAGSERWVQAIQQELKLSSITEKKKKETASSTRRLVGFEAAP